MVTVEEGVAGGWGLDGGGPWDGGGGRWHGVIGKGEEEGGLQRLPGSGLCVLGKLGSPFKSAHVVAFWWLRECAW